MVAAVKFTGLTKSFGAVQAVRQVDLEIAEGEFFSMLGPSGSGKTTCLRLIAGFERPSAGVIEVFGQSVEALPPYRRPVNTVFQDYALFPHLSVRDNVAYGLMVRGVPKRQRHDQAEAMLDLVKLGGLGGRRPVQLSGGQRQRVALARALVNEPRVLLLDEPLGALDLKLREQMQLELKALQRRLGITFIFVTHDQGEALSMSDRVAVFSAGQIAQVGPPEAIYEYPETRFVADFVGSANVLERAVVAGLGGPDCACALRPEAVTLMPAALARPLAADSRLSLTGVVADVQYQGAVRRVLLDAAGCRLAAAVPAYDGIGLTVGASVIALFARQSLRPLKEEGTA